MYKNQVSTVACTNTFIMLKTTSQCQRHKKKKPNYNSSMFVFMGKIERFRAPLFLFSKDKKKNPATSYYKTPL